MRLNRILSGALLLGVLFVTPVLAESDSFGGRDMILAGAAQPHALIVALHGGGGNARFMQSHLALDGQAKANGFAVAYLNGSGLGGLLPGNMHAWNSGGGCCGKPAQNNVDDVGYITSAVQYLKQKYGVADGQVFVVGHSNGSMMAQRMLCETSVFAAGVAISGPLAPDIASCAAARGHQILAIHGQLDENVPVAGGKGTKGPMRVQRDVQFSSEESAQQRFEASGARYQLKLIPQADHALAHIAQQMESQEGVTLAQSILSFIAQSQRAGL